MKSLVGYCRVSTDNQKEEGTIEIQVKSLTEYAKTHTYERYKGLMIYKDVQVKNTNLALI